MNDRGQYGPPPISGGQTPTWAVAVIATGVGMALHALWGVAAKKRNVATWTAR